MWVFLGEVSLGKGCGLELAQGVGYFAQAGGNGAGHQAEFSAELIETSLVRLAAYTGMEIEPVGELIVALVQICIALVFLALPCRLGSYQLEESIASHVCNLRFFAPYKERLA